MQSGMVSATLKSDQPGSYLQQLVLCSNRFYAPDRIARATAVLAGRHEALRIRFEWKLDVLHQSIVPELVPTVECRPWQGQQQWEQFLAADRKRAVDFFTEPLWRLTIIEGAPEATRVVWTYHHSLLDGRARRMLTEEWASLLEEPDTLLAHPEPGWATYLNWYHGLDHSKSIPFWRDYLAGVSPAVSLPLPAPLPAAGLAKGLVTAIVSRADTASLRELAKQNGCSLNNVFQTAWAIVLGRYLGSDDVVFGTARACRASALDGAGAGVVGLLINSVPFRFRLSGETRISGMLRSARLTQLSLRDHEYTPPNRITEAAGLRVSDLLFETYLMFEDTGARDSLHIDGWSVDLHERTGEFSLAARAGTEVRLSLEFDPARYGQAAVKRLLGDFLKVLKIIEQSPEMRVDDIAAFRLSLVSATLPASLPHVCVVDAVRRQAREAGNRLACVDGDRTLTYAELEAASNRLAHYLNGKGVGPGTRVAVALPRSADLLVAFLGIWKAGACYVPVDPEYPEERRRYMLQDSGASVMLTTLPEISALPDPDHGWTIDPNATAYVIYTSGSTGKPKGVAISHRSLANLCAAMVREYRIGPEDRVLQGSTINFDISVEEIFPALWAGAAVLPAGASAMSSVSEFLEFVETRHATLLDLPTSFWHELTSALQQSKRALPSSVRLVAVGGEKVSPAAYEAWRAIPGTSSVRWLNTYGPTETTVTATVFEQPAEFSGSLPIGHPIDGTSAYVLDSRLRPMPLEAAGELYIGGEGVALEYLNSPEQNQRSFLPDPFHPHPPQGRQQGQRMYKTGDQVRLLESGELEYLGRRDFQVKFRGYRIEPGEIEAAAESHADVDRAVALVRDGKTLVLFAVKRPGSVATSEDLLVHLRGQLAAWMIPNLVQFLPALPVAPGGKIDRRKLETMPVEPATAEPASRPVNETERKILAIWQSLFEGKPIGPEDNFFSLGGYSLLAMRMLARIEQEFGRGFRLGDLNRAPTVRSLAKLLAGHSAGEAPEAKLPECLVVLHDGSGAPPLFCFHSVGGVVHWYNDLALRIDKRPVIGVQGLDESEPGLPGSVGEMAEGYLNAIRTYYPKGPLYLIGHSMGAMLAYHCAVLSKERGEEVALVASIDGWYRAADNPGVAVKLWRTVRHVAKMDLAEKAEFVREKFNWLRSESANQSARAAAGAETGALDSIKANNVRLARAYIAPPYDGVMHVFRAKKRSASQDPDPTLGWRHVARKVIAREIPGSHYDVLAPGNVEVLVQELKNIMDAPPVWDLTGSRATHRI